MITKLKRILRPKNLLLPAFLLAFLIIAGCAPAGTTVPRGWSGGVIADSTLFIGSMDGKLVALNTADGKTVGNDVPLETSSTVVIYGSPVVAGELVYLGGYIITPRTGGEGKFYAFIWGRDEPRWVYPRQGTVDGSIVGGSVVAQDKVFFGAANGNVYALDAADGFKVWIFPTGNKIWSTPAILDDTLFVGSFDKKLYALNTATGNERWTFETQGAIAATPLIYDNTVYIGSFDRYLYALDATTGRLKWKFTEAQNWFWAKPVVKDNIIYAASLNGKVYALDARSGNKLAEFDLGSPVSSSLVVAGDVVVAANEDGVVYALDAGNELRELRRLGERVQAPLATDGTVVYIHTSAGELHAVNAQSGAELWSLSLRSN